MQNNDSSDDENDDSYDNLPLRRKNIFDSSGSSVDRSYKQLDDVMRGRLCDPSPVPAIATKALSVTPNNARSIVSPLDDSFDTITGSFSNIDSVRAKQNVSIAFDDSVIVASVRKKDRKRCIIIDSEDESKNETNDSEQNQTNDSEHNKINDSVQNETYDSIQNETDSFIADEIEDTVDSEQSIIIEDSPVKPSEKYGGKFKIKPKSSPSPKLNSFSNTTHSFSSTSDRNTSVLNTSRNSPCKPNLSTSLNVSGMSTDDICNQLKQKKSVLKTVDLSALPDGGQRIKRQVKELETALHSLSVDSNNDESIISVHDVSSSSSRGNTSADISSDTSSRGIIQQKSPSKVMSTVNPNFVYRCEPPTEPTREEIELERLENMKMKVDDLDLLLRQKRMAYQATNLRVLPDGGARMLKEISNIERELMMIHLRMESTTIKKDIKPVYNKSPLEDLNNINIGGGGSSSSQSQAVHYRQPTLPQNAVNALYAADNNYGGRDYGGKLSHAREREMIRVTSDTLEVFQAVHASMPETERLDVEAIVEPAGLKVTLMDHQKRALVWMLWRETQDSPGGILADDMGLGKTLTMLSLILRHRELIEDGTIEDFAMNKLRDSDDSSDEENEEKAHGWLARNRMKKLRKTEGTLIVCPASLIGQWEREAKTRISSRKMSIVVYHGTNRDTNVGRLCQHDLIITTYTVAMKEAFGKGGCKTKYKNADGIPKVFRSDQGSLYQIGWSRIILDEAHVIRNHKSQTAQAMCMLKGGRRWVVTGTPVHNKEMDLFSLIRFLRISPFDDYTCWKHQIQNGSAQGRIRLALVTKAIILRRTKDQLDVNTGKKLVELPEKRVIEHALSLSQEERQIYDRVFTFSRSSLMEYMKTHEQKEMEKEAKTSKKPPPPSLVTPEDFTPTLTLGNMLDSEVKTHHLLVLLLRLRQVCCHPALIKAVSCTIITLVLITFSS